MVAKSNFYRRKLPHWQPGATDYFVTYRLAQTLPRSKISELQNLRKELKAQQTGNDKGISSQVQRKVFEKYESLIDGEVYGPTWLQNPEIAELVSSSIKFREPDKYFIYAYTIMSNHVHQVIKINPSLNRVQFPLTKIMKGLKGYTGFKANRILNRTGAFWHDESFDRVIRNEDELENTIRYTINNPVKAGLVEYWEDWPFTYCYPAYARSFK